MNVLKVHGPQMKLDRDPVLSILVTTREDYNPDIERTGSPDIPYASEADLVFRWLRDSLPSGTFDALMVRMEAERRNRVADPSEPPSESDGDTVLIECGHETCTWGYAGSDRAAVMDAYFGHGQETGHNWPVVHEG